MKKYISFAGFLAGICGAFGFLLAIIPSFVETIAIVNTSTYSLNLYQLAFGGTSGLLSVQPTAVVIIAFILALLATIGVLVVATLQQLGKKVPYVKIIYGVITGLFVISGCLLFFTQLAVMETNGFKNYTDVAGAPVYRVGTGAILTGIVNMFAGMVCVFAIFDND